MPSGWISPLGPPIRETSLLSPPTDSSLSLAPSDRLPSSQVLTTGFWPTYRVTELALPKEMVECVETFMTYYQLGVRMEMGLNPTS